MAPYGRAYAFQALGKGLREIARIQGDARRERLTREEQERLRGERDRELRAQELAQPGARPFEDVWQEELARGEVPLTPTSLNEIGNAQIERPSFSFRSPAPRTVTDEATGETITTQDPTRYLTPRGVVMDPGAPVRYERGLEAERLALAGNRELAVNQKNRLGRIIEIQMAIPGISPQKAALMVDREGNIDQGQLLRAKHPEMYRTEWSTGAEAAARRGLPTYNQALEAVQSRYAEYDAEGKWTGRFTKPWEEMDAEAREMTAGRGMRPEAKKPEITAPAPAPAKGPGFLTRLGRAVVPGGRGWSDEAPRGTPRRGYSPAVRPPLRPGVEPEGSLPSDTAGFGAARQRARELQAQGKSRDEIKQIMTSEGFKVQ